MADRRRTALLLAGGLGAVIAVVIGFGFVTIGLTLGTVAFLGGAAVAGFAAGVVGHQQRLAWSGDNFAKGYPMANVMLQSLAGFLLVPLLIGPESLPFSVSDLLWATLLLLASLPLVLDPNREFGLWALTDYD